MFKFHFHIPDFVENSNGILTLWEAAYQFSLVRDVTISSFYHGSERVYPVPNRYLHLVKPASVLTDETIVIYPDAAHGNPLNAKNVARYMLAKEYILNGNPIQFKDSDYIFSYSNAVNRSADQYNILLDSLTELKNFHTKKISGKVSVYYGKCRVGIEIHEYKNILKKFKEVNVITRTNPSSKEVLYREIASSELFISFDSLSSLCYEATLLGTPVILMDDVSKYFYDAFNYKLHGFYYQEHVTDIDKIIDSHADLYKVANEELIAQLSMVPKSTNSIIRKIENHFLNPGKSFRGLYQKEDLQFFIDSWKCSPIINCTNLKTVYGFHMMHSKPKLYFVLRTAHLFIWRLIRLFRAFKRKCFEFWNKFLSSQSLYPQNEYVSLEYSLNKAQYIERCKSAIVISKQNEENLSSHPVFNMPISKFMKIMRFICT
jgi:hypothetical protein